MRRVFSRGLVLPVVFFLILFLQFGAITASAFNLPDPPLNFIRDFDVRQQALQIKGVQAVPPVIPDPMRLAIESLRLNVPTLQIRWSPFTSAPSRIYSLTQALTGPSAALPQTIAMDFVNGNLNLFNLAPADVNTARFSRNFATKHNGVTHLTMQQQVNNLDVFGAAIRINVDRDGRVLNVSGEPILGVAGLVNSALPAVQQADAFKNAAADANITTISKQWGKGLVYFPMSTAELRLAWSVIVADADSPNVFHSLVDAMNGNILWRQNLLQYQQGLIYPSDSPSPDTPSGTSNCTSNPYPACAVSRVLRPFDGGDFFGAGDPHYDWWHDTVGSPDVNTTKGNNAHAKEDQDADDDDTEGFPTVTGRNFSFNVDLSLDPTTEDATTQNRSAAIANAFYWVNRIHDIYYSLGFDEAAGNFQSDNFGLGGVGGDPVQVDVQDGGGNCNSGFWSTHTDGDPVRMSLYLCTNSTPQRDAAFENLIVFHEYTHGLVKRLVDIGPYYSQSGGLQDGSCDFMGLANTSEATDDLTLSYPRGQWYYNKVEGNRRQPYSTDQSVFTRTYANIADNADPWPAGEIWCNTLWITRANLVWKHGFNAGGRTMLQLAVDGMKQAPLKPDYLDMRDAILTADNTNNGGANRCLIWDGFARMGMGVSAASTGDQDSSPAEAFDIPADCTPDIAAPLATDLGNVCVGAARSQPITIDNTGAGDLFIRSMTKQPGSHDDISIDALAHPIIIAPGASETLTARCASTAGGSKTATFRLVTNDPDESQVDLTVTCSSDATPPDLICPPDATIECTTLPIPSNTGTATVAGEALPVTYTDNVTGGACPQAQNILRTWKAVDSCGNTTTCSQTIHVVDTIPPNIAGTPANVTLSCEVPVPTAPVLTATDNCDGAPTLSFGETRTDGSCAYNYQLTRTWRAQDHCANAQSTSQVITVQDSTPPTIQCNAPATIVPPDAPIAFTATAIDNCGAPSVSIAGYNCVGPTGKSKLESCKVRINGNSVTILDSGGVGDRITWTARATDTCGNPSELVCGVTVVNPGKKK